MPRSSAPTARRRAVSAHKPRTSKTKPVARTGAVASLKRHPIRLFVAIFGLVLAMSGFAYYAQAATVSGRVTGIAGRCLDIAYGNAANTTPAQIYDCNGSKGQAWAINSDGTIRNQGYCLDVGGASTKVKSTVQIYQCNGSAGEYWNIRADKTIQNANSGLCLTTQSGASYNGTRLWTWPCDTLASQQWTVPSGSPLQAASADVSASSTTDTTSAPKSNTKAASSRSALYVIPNTPQATQATTWKTSNPTGSAYMSRFAALPSSEWYGNWISDVKTAVNTQVTNAANSNQVPILVAYNIPGRDCGSYSAGGAGSDTAYASWINDFAAGIGMNRAAIVVLEPDAIAGMDDCLSADQQAARMRLLSNAVSTLRTQTNASVYLDAGNPGWRSAELMASRLLQSNVAQATGFSLNVSNFYTNAQALTYGNSVSGQVNGKHFLIDSSRNGKGSNGEWCNPDGRAFGTAPTLSSGVATVDGFLYLKKAGGSDGACGPTQMGTSAPTAGQWWPQYAYMLAKNAGW